MCRCQAKVHVQVILASIQQCLSFLYDYFEDQRRSSVNWALTGGAGV